MDCEGLVTEVDPFYGYFEVDEKYRVYMCLLKTNIHEIKLPEISSNSISKNLHKCLNTFIACPSSCITGKLNVNITLNSFINLIKKYELGAADILIIDQILKTFKSNFYFDNETTEKLIFCSLLEEIIKLHLLNTKSYNTFCLNNCLTDISLTTINSCKYVEIISTNFTNFPQWSFGVHSKPKKFNYLFGFLYIDIQYGFLMLKDDFHKMVCIIQNNLNFKINYCYVLIKNYKIITEIYKDSKIPNLEYLFTDAEDIIILQDYKKYGLSGLMVLNNFEYNLEFILLRKSTICINQDKKTETYLQIKVIRKNGNQVDDTYFLTLPSEYTIIVLYLKEGFKYKLHHNKSLKEVVNVNLFSIEKLKNFLINEKDAYFEELEIAENTQISVLNIEECRQYILKSSKMFSFEGVIHSRGFVKNLSKKSKRTSLYGFSTPGTDTHTLKFVYQENGQNLNMTVYLNNWINRLMPLGLIPQMRVLLKHVQPKSTYIKSTIFTSIEIVSYEQLVNFHTANLFENYEVDWGPPYFLSKGNHIPQGVIVWSKIYNIHIFEVKMNNTCKNCNIIVESSLSCNCGCEEIVFNFFLLMQVNDIFGISRVIVKDVKFLKLVLNLTETQFSIWLEAFRGIGSFSFNIHENEYFLDQMFNANNFKNALSLFLLTFNNSLLEDVELKCRKLSAKENKKGSKDPNWFYLDARRNLQI